MFLANDSIYNKFNVKLDAHFESIKFVKPNLYAFI